jgi:hypothetical protein
MTIDPKLIDQLLTNYKKPEDIIGENGLLKELTKAILERALAAEMTDHLGYEKHDPVGHHRGNTRNGKSPKTLKGEFGELELETPRDPCPVRLALGHNLGIERRLVSRVLIPRAYIEMILSSKPATWRRCTTSKSRRR